MYTGQTKSATDIWTKTDKQPVLEQIKKGNGIGLDIHCKEMTTVSVFMTLSVQIGYIMP